MKRFFAKALRRLTGRADPTSVSDNDAYPRLCMQASRDPQVFAEFRRHPAYNEILEHVTEEQGRQYLEVLSADADLLSAMEQFKRNDDYGGPRTYEYPSIGTISPSTLRYVKVLADLKSLFGTLSGYDVCEIGVGYGGQCRIINAWFKPATYRLVDIAPALSLARRYLENYHLPSTLSYQTINGLAEDGYDLMISNYAFTELPRPIQEVYLQKVVLRSARGYITYNEITPAEFNSFRADELLGIISGSKRLEEKPLTHAGNCIIAWGL